MSPRTSFDVWQIGQVLVAAGQERVEHADLAAALHNGA